jgi:hypothetical protein
MFTIMLVLILSVIGRRMNLLLRVFLIMFSFMMDTLLLIMLIEFLMNWAGISHTEMLLYNSAHALVTSVIN